MRRSGYKQLDRSSSKLEVIKKFKNMRNSILVTILIFGTIILSGCTNKDTSLDLVNDIPAANNEKEIEGTIVDNDMSSEKEDVLQCINQGVVSHTAIISGSYNVKTSVSLGDGVSGYSLISTSKDNNKMYYWIEGASNNMEELSVFVDFNDLRCAGVWIGSSSGLEPDIQNELKKSNEERTLMITNKSKKEVLEEIKSKAEDADSVCEYVSNADFSIPADKNFQDYCEMMKSIPSL